MPSNSSSFMKEKVPLESLLNDLQKTLVPGMELSNAKVVEKLILDKKADCVCGDQKEKHNGSKENIKNTQT